jgi:hypothetical protein
MAYTIGHGASFILCTAGSIPLAGSAGLSADLGHFTVAGPRLCNLEMDEDDTPDMINKYAGDNEGILTPFCRWAFARRLPGRFSARSYDVLKSQQRCQIMILLRIEDMG